MKSQKTETCVAEICFVFLISYLVNHLTTSQIYFTTPRGGHTLLVGHLCPAELLNSTSNQGG